MTMQDLLTPRQHRRNYFNMAEERNIEMTVIGTVISTPTTYNDVAKYILDNSVWSDVRCRRLWSLISGMVKRREHVDSITIVASLETEDKMLGVDNVYIIDCVENRGLDTAVEVYAKKMYEKHLPVSYTHLTLPTNREV